MLKSWAFLANRDVKMYSICFGQRALLLKKMPSVNCIILECLRRNEGEEEEADEVKEEKEEEEYNKEIMR